MVENPRPPEEDEEAATPKEGEGEPALAAPLNRVDRIKLAARIYADRFENFLWSREPHLWPTLVTAIAVSILLSLGFWQIQRLEWKNDIIRTTEEKLAMPALDMSVKFPRNETEWKKLENRQIIVKGNWISLHPFKMIPRTYEGEVGYHLILPLKLSDGQIVFVNRGFVPDTGAMLPLPEEKVFAVQGVLRAPETHKSWATPENVPSRGVWTWADLAAMRHEIGVNSSVPLILYQAREEAQDSYPIGGQLPVPMYNRHRQYALIWFALAIAFMGIWMIGSNPKEKIKPTEENTAANDDDRMKDPVARRGLYPEATD